MASKTVDTGNFGKWKIIIDQVSQSQANNTSQVRVRGQLINESGSSSFSNNDISKSISGTNSWSGSGGFNVPGGGTETIIDRTFTVEHGPEGYKTVEYTINYGNTGTFTFGDPPALTLSMSLDRIPKPPDKMATPSRSFDAPRDITLTWDNPDNGGSTIQEYQIRYDTNSNFSSPSFISDIGSAMRSRRFTLPAIDTTYWFAMRARNGIDWGPWSGSTSYSVPDTPAAPAKPTLQYTPATTMEINWSAPDNGGASINGYDIQYADNASFSNAKLKSVSSSARSTTVTDLTVGPTWYFRVRATNSQGDGDWSSAASYLVVCGPRIKVNGVYVNTIAYVKVDGVWKTAIPYVREGGVWKVAGG